MASRAFSYLRFSTGEQERGDSFRRQRDLAVRYCAEHGLELDGRSFHDLGISGFRGRNVRGGALGAFLRAIDDGLVKAGDYLLVENLDRVSRQQPWDALPVFQQIINAGVIVVTLQDRRRYSRETLQANPFLIMESLLGMIRANEESATKAARLRAMWAGKRAAISERPLTARCPAWLTLGTTPPGRFHIDEARAAIVQRIFEETLAGIGQESIAKRLNKAGVPTFGGARYWHRSYVCKVLANPAVVGDFIPHVDEYIDGKRRRRPQEVVRSYFPAVIDRGAFDTVQAMRADRKTPRVHGVVRSLIAGLAVCPLCGEPMSRINKASARKPVSAYLVCRRAKYGGTCAMPGVPYAAVEEALLAGVEEFTSDVPAGHDIARNELAGIDAQIAGVNAKIARVKDHIMTGEELRSEPIAVRGPKAAREQVALQRAGKFHRQQLNDLLDALGEELDKLKKERKTHEERLAALDAPTLRARQREVQATLTARPLDCGRANAALRALFSKIVIDRDRKMLTLHWHFGGQSEIDFEPDPEPNKSDRIRELLASRFSMAEIAAKIPCSKDYVRLIRSRDGRAENGPTGAATGR